MWNPHKRIMASSTPKASILVVMAIFCILIQAAPSGEVPKQTNFGHMNVLIDRPQTTENVRFFNEPFGHIAHHGLPHTIILNSLVTPSHYKSGLPNCDISIVNGMIHTTNKEDSLQVFTLGKIVSLQVFQLAMFRFNGHVLVSQGNCTAILMGLSLCDDSDITISKFDPDCFVHNDFSMKLIIVIGVVIALMIFIMTRYLWVRIMYHPKGNRLSSSSGGWFNFINTYVPTDTEGIISFNKDSEEISVIPLQNRRKIVFNSKRLLMAMFLFHIPSGSLAMMHNMSFSQLMMSEGSLISIHNNTLQVGSAKQMFPLHEEYFTMPFETKVVQTYHCYTSSCDLPVPCELYGPSGVFTSRYMRTDSEWPGSRVRRLQFCSPGSSACIFSKGCQKWEVIFLMNTKLKSPVFSFGQSVTSISTIMTGPDDISVVTSELKDQYIPEDVSIVHFKRERWYVCPYPVRKAQPRHGVLGDIQTNEHDLVTQSDEIVRCKYTVSSNAQCEMNEAFFSQIPYVCKLLPSIVGSYSLAIVGDVIEAKKDGNLKVTLKHSGGMEVKPADSSCGIISGVYYSLQSSMFSSYIILTTSVDSGRGSVSYQLPCLGTTVYVPCDGRTHQFEVPTIEDCKVKDPRITVKTVSPDDLEFYHKKGINGLEYQESGGTFKGYIPHLLSNIGVVTVSTVSLLMFLVFFVIIVKCIRLVNK